MPMRTDGQRRTTARVTDPRLPTVLKQLTIAGAVVGAAMVALLSREILPERFFRDDNTIRDYIDGREVGVGPSPYSSTAFLFEILGLGSAPIAVAFLSVAMFTVATILALNANPGRTWSWTLILLSSAAIVLAGLYLSPYSKEFFLLPIAIAFLITARNHSVRSEAVWLTLVLLYGLYVREYWVLILFLYLAIRVVLTFKMVFAQLVAVISVGIALLVLSFNVILGIPANYYRLTANQELIADRATVISDPFASMELWAQILNIEAVLIFLIVPLPLLFAGSLNHVVSSAVIFGFWLLVILSARKILLARRLGLLQTSEEVSGLLRALAWILAMVITQSLFEPDYGSYLRHLVPLMPVFIYFIVRSERLVSDYMSSTLQKL